MEKINLESFYDKYFSQFWGCLGYLVTVSFFLNTEAIERNGWLTNIGLSFLLTVPITMFLYCVFVIFSFAVSIFFRGVKDKDIAAIFAGFWLIIGSFSFLSGLSSHTP
ncbi:MAG TPA: hypothetical protein EYQ26_07280 [Rhodospirillales bacterium]|nr:hypothetical protein [Rhodospirillales bacterium]